jgi:hypothetical protein
VIKQTVVIIEAYHFCQVHTKLYPTILLSRLTPYAEEIIGSQQVDFNATGQLLKPIFCIHQILKKKLEYNEAVHQLLYRLHESL